MPGGLPGRLPGGSKALEGSRAGVRQEAAELASEAARAEGASIPDTLCSRQADRSGTAATARRVAGGLAAADQAEQAEQAGPLLWMSGDQRPHRRGPASAGQPRDGPLAVSAVGGAGRGGGEVGAWLDLRAGRVALAAGLLDRRTGPARLVTHHEAITVIGGLGALSGRQLLADAADAAVAASRKRAQVDPMTPEELDQDVERFALDCVAISHTDRFPQVWDDWQQVEQLLDARQNLKDRAHLTMLGGQLSYFLARLSFNLADYAAARRHAVLAWEYAEDVGQPVLCASVRTLQGTIAYYGGQPQRSLDLLRAAEPYDTPYNRARIAANTARAYAALGDRPSAERALAAMERQLVDLPVQPGDAPYTPGTAMSALASTLVRVGDGEAAEAYARQAVALHNVSAVKDTLFEDEATRPSIWPDRWWSGGNQNPRKQRGLASRRSRSPRNSGPRRSASEQWSCPSCSTPGARARRSRLRRTAPRLRAARVRRLSSARILSEGRDCRYRCDPSTTRGRTSPVTVSSRPILLTCAVMTGWLCNRSMPRTTG